MKRSAVLALALFSISLTSHAASDFKDYVTCLAVDASGRLYAGASANGNGIFTSSNGGATWQQTKMHYGVSAITVSKTGTVVTFANGYALGRYLFRLKNAGTELDSVTLAFTPSAITAGPDGALYATTFNEGIYTSVDDGAHWTKITWLFGNGLILPSIAVTNNNIILLGTREGFFSSSDKGAFWSRGWIQFHDSVTLKQILPAPGGKIYAGGFEGMWINAYEIFVTADTGRNWTMVSKLKFDLDAMAIDSLGTMFVGSKSGVYRIAANGDSVHLGLSEAAMNGLGVRSLLALWKDTLFAGAYGGVYRTVDAGAHWQLLDVGMITDTSNADYTAALPFGSHISCGVVDDQNNFIVGTDSAGVFRSVDRGKTWMQTMLNVANVTGVVFDTLKTLYASSFEGGVYSSPDHGVSWTTTDASGSQLNGRHIYALSAFSRFFPFGGTDSSRMIPEHMILAGTDEGVYKYNADGGFGRWSQMPTITHAVTALAVHGPDVFARTIGGEVYISDGGWNGWTLKGTTDKYPASLVTDDQGMLYKAGACGVFRSADKGATWVQKNSGITDTVLVSAAVDQAGEIFVGSRYNGDIYKSGDQGEHWTKIATLGYPVRCLIMSMDGENLYAAAAGRLFRTVIIPTAVDPSREALRPNDFSLSQNYPNPFNPSTVIRYGLGSASTVTLRVYDLLGREVRTLVDARQQAGEHSVTFDAAGLPGGVYFYRLQTDVRAVTKRLLLLK